VSRYSHRRIAMIALVGVVVTAACGAQNGQVDDTTAGGAPSSSQSAEPGWIVQRLALPAGVEHVHGLLAGSDGTLVMGTHHGLYRVGSDGTATVVGATRHDLMGLVRADDGTLLASGHPEPGSTLADPLGLIASDDGGLTWKPRSQQGEVDFHSLAVRGERMVGLSSEALMFSADEGRSWTSKGPTVAWSLSIDTRDIWAAGAAGLMHSADDGATFAGVPDAPRLGLGTAANDATAWGIDLDGVVWVRPASAWERVGTVGGVEALAAIDANTAYIVQEKSLVILTRQNPASLRRG
jgi:hypothetical protein